MKLSKSLLLALVWTVLSTVSTAALGQESFQSMSLVESRPMIRFCDYSLQPPVMAGVQTAFRAPLGEEVAKNSYWETEQTQMPVPPPALDSPLQNLSPPAMGTEAGNCVNGMCTLGTPGGCTSGCCSSGGCTSGGCTSGGCTSGGCTSGGCTSGGCTSGGCTSGCGGGCGGPGGCTCCDACKCCKPPIQLIALAEATFFWPQLQRDFLTNSVNNGGGSQQFLSDRATGSIDGSLLVAPRISLGFQGCKWGLVGRYWNGTNWASGYIPSVPGTAFSGLNASDGFKAYTADLEVQRRFQGCTWTNYGFVGARYASINNDRYLSSSSSFSGEFFSASSFASQQFDGAGVTFGFWGSRPLNECSPLSLYYVNRYSFLGGHGTAIAQTTATAANTANGFGTSTNGGIADNDGTMFIGELQLGFQWNAKLNCLPGTAILRTGLEYQYWDTNAGVLAGANSTAFINNNSTTATSIAGDMLFHLIGLNIGAGIVF